MGEDSLGEMQTLVGFLTCNVSVCLSGGCHLAFPLKGHSGVTETQTPAA